MGVNTRPLCRELECSLTSGKKPRLVLKMHVPQIDHSTATYLQQIIITARHVRRIETRPEVDVKICLTRSGKSCTKRLLDVVLHLPGRKLTRSRSTSIYTFIMLER